MNDRYVSVFVVLWVMMIVFGVLTHFMETLAKGN